MGKEIERKFLVKHTAYRKLGVATYYSQGYIKRDVGQVVRVRIAGERAFLTIKKMLSSMSRLEYEYEIPLPDAKEMLEQLCDKPIIEKHRYIIQHNNEVWEVDEFHGDNEGLVVAEVEIPDEGYKFELPDWVGEEVTSDNRYLNANLIDYPYAKWQNK